MDRMLVVIFDTERQAVEGKKALRQLDNEAIIVLYRYAVITRNADGTMALIQSDDTGPIGALVGTSLGTFIGLLGGPAGAAIGATLGLLAGGAVDLNNARIGDDFLEDVTRELQSGKFGLVAEIQESWTSAVDMRMENIGGTVLRRTMSEAKETIDKVNAAENEAYLARAKAEDADGHARRMEKMGEKINQLNSKIQTRLELAKERRLAAMQRARTRAEDLEARAASLKEKAQVIHL